MVVFVVMMFMFNKSEEILKEVFLILCDVYYKFIFYVIFWKDYIVVIFLWINWKELLDFNDLYNINNNCFNDWDFV